MTTVLTVMSGPWGRGLRVAAGLGLFGLAVAGGGWGWLLLIPGALMVTTGIINYCPAAAFSKTPTDRSEFMRSLGPRNLLR